MALISQTMRASRVMVAIALFVSSGCADEVVTVTKVGFEASNCFNGEPISVYLIELYTIPMGLQECHECYTGKALCERQKVCWPLESASRPAYVMDAEDDLSGVRFMDVDRDRPLCLRVMGFESLPSCDVEMTPAASEALFCAHHRTPVYPSSSKIMLLPSCPQLEDNPIKYEFERCSGRPSGDLVPDGGPGRPDDFFGPPMLDAGILPDVIEPPLPPPPGMDGAPTPP